MNKHYESELADEVYDKLFDNEGASDLDFCLAFPDAEVIREFAVIKLNDEFVLKIERV